MLTSPANVHAISLAYASKPSLASSWRTSGCRHLFLIAGVIAVHTAAAQDTTGSHVKIIDEQGKGAAGNGGMAIQLAGGASSIQVTPKQVVIDPSSKTATITLTNAGNDTAKATMTVKDVKATGGGATPSSSSSPAIAGSLASWVPDLPSQVTLAPHETRSITVHVTVPDHLTAGEYAADVVVGSPGGTPKIDNAMLQQALQSMLGKMGGGNGATMNMQIMDGNGHPIQLQGAPASGGSGAGTTCRLVYHAS